MFMRLHGCSLPDTSEKGISQHTPVPLALTNFSFPLPLYVATIKTHTHKVVYGLRKNKKVRCVGRAGGRKGKGKNDGTIF